MEKKVLISIVITAFNESESQIKECLKSIEKQTYKEFEVILILDNPNNLKLLKLLEKFEKKYYFLKLYVNNKNMGLAKSLNKGIELSKGDIIARMDSDDVMLEDRLEKQIEYLLNNDVDLLGTNALLINEDSDVIGEIKCPSKIKDIKKKLFYKNCMIHSSIMFKKEVFISINGYRNFPSSQDYDFFCRLVAKNYKIENLEISLVKYRIRENSIGNSNISRQFLLAKYINKLYKERLNLGEDSFDQRKIEEIIKLSLEEEKIRKRVEIGIKNKNGILKNIEKFKAIFKSKIYLQMYLLKIKETILEI